MYPRMDQVKFMEDSLMVEDSDKVYLLISIPPPWNHQKTYGFLIILRGIEGNKQTISLKNF